MKLKSLFVAACSLAILATGCKKDSNPGNEQPPKGNFKIEFEHTFDADEFALGTPYTTASSEELTFNTVRYYISNIKLKTTTGTEWIQPESYYLIDLSIPGSAIINIPDVPAGDYTEVTYTIGVDSTRNVSGAQTGALSPANNMFWSWNSGYIFMKFEGESPQVTGGFAYHIGGYKAVESALHTNTHGFAGAMMMVKPGATPQLHLKVDMKQLFDGANALSVVTTQMVHMPGPDAQKVAGNFHQCFSFEHLHN